jgi:hypothetical protein
VGERRGVAAIGLSAFIVVATACSGVTHPGAPLGTPSTATSAEASQGATPSANVPNPFTIVARYAAASLGLEQPVNLAIGPDGNLFVTDSRPSVTVVSPMGKVLRRWGRAGSGQGEFSFVVDLTGNLHASIAVGSDGKVYISDSGNQRVDVFSATGGFVRAFGTSGTGRGQFLAIFDLAVDRSGNVYVADDQQETLSKFSPTGRFEWTIGGSTATDPDLVGHFHLADVDSHGRLVAANDDANRIVYIDAHGHKVDAFETSDLGESPCNVTVDSVGDTVVQSCPDGKTTLVFDRAHRLVGAWDQSPFATDVIPRFGPHGEVFAMTGDGTILKLKVALPNA